MKKIITIFILLIIIITILFQKNIYNNYKKNTNIPKIIIPQKSIEFIITKKENNELIFNGIFAKIETPKQIAKFLKKYHIEHQIEINPKLSPNQKVISLIEKILPKLVNSYKNWKIIYKNDKLLVSGKTANIKSKNNIENILELSSINSFSNIEIIKESIILSNLKNIIEKETTKKDEIPTEDEAKKILSNLKTTIPPLKNNHSIQKRKKETKNKKRKKHIAHNKLIIKHQKKIVKKSTIKKELTTKEYQKILTQKEPDKNILALPPIQTVDMNIEEKIQKGVIPQPKTPKPLIKEPTIFIKSNNKIDKNIPWAKLHDINEKVDGIFINENIN